jgi:hypothetical protein
VNPSDWTAIIHNAIFKRSMWGATLLKRLQAKRNHCRAIVRMHASQQSAELNRPCLGQAQNPAQLARPILFAGVKIDIEKPDLTHIEFWNSHSISEHKINPGPH